MGITLSQQKQTSLDLEKNVSQDFLHLCHWSLLEVRKSYQCYRRRFNKITLDGLMLSKLFPFTRKISMSIFIKYSERLGRSRPYPHEINIFELICALVLLSHADCICKIQFLLILFDFSHEPNKTFAQTLIIFDAMISAYCRITKQQHPSYLEMRSYAENCFLKASLREDSQVSLKKIQALIDANEDIHQIFMRFQPQNVVQQTHVLFKKFPIYLESQINDIKLSIKQLYLEKQTTDPKKKRSLSYSLLSPVYKYNKKVQFHGFSIEKVEEKLDHVANSTSRDKLPSIFKNKKIIYNSIPRLIFVGGTSISKDDIFNLLHYFYKLSGGQQIILYQDFLQNFGELTFMKKMISNTFKFLDTKQKGKITFENLLGRLFPSLALQDMKLIKTWTHQYRTIYEIGYNSTNQKQKEQTIFLPSQSLVRLKEIFKVLDHGNKGYLTFDDLKTSFKIGYNAKDLEATFKTLDPEGTNKLNMRQLARLLLPGNYQIEGLL